MTPSSVSVFFHKHLARMGAILILLVLAGCSSLELASRWADRPIDVDGRNTEWAAHTATIESKKLTIGFANDTNYVYMLLETSDRTMSRKMMMQGLTVWFDPQGGRGKTFGIHYPLGVLSGQSSRSRSSQTDALNALKGGSSMSELEVVRPGAEKPERLSVLATVGIQARVKYEEPAFVYELRIPYTADKKFPFSIGANPGTAIGVGLETPDVGGSSGSTGGSTGAAGGGRGRGGRGGSASTGSEPDRIQEQAEPLNDWMKVQLLSPDSVRTK